MASWFVRWWALAIFTGVLVGGGMRPAAAVAAGDDHVVYGVIDLWVGSTAPNVVAGTGQIGPSLVLTVSHRGNGLLRGLVFDVLPSLPAGVAFQVRGEIAPPIPSMASSGRSSGYSLVRWSPSFSICGSILACRLAKRSACARACIRAAKTTTRATARPSASARQGRVTATASAYVETLAGMTIGINVVAFDGQGLVVGAQHVDHPAGQGIHWDEIQISGLEVPQTAFALEYRISLFDQFGGFGCVDLATMSLHVDGLPMGAKLSETSLPSEGLAVGTPEILGLMLDLPPAPAESGADFTIAYSSFDVDSSITVPVASEFIDVTFGDLVFEPVEISIFEDGFESGDTSAWTTTVP